MSASALSAMKTFAAFFQALGKDQAIVSDRGRASVVPGAARLTSVDASAAGAVLGGSSVPRFAIGLTPLRDPVGPNPW
jgi:hypothetical protein